MRDQPANSAGEVFTSVRQLPPSSRASSAALTPWPQYAREERAGRIRSDMQARDGAAVDDPRPSEVAVATCQGPRRCAGWRSFRDPTRLCSAPVIETSPVATRRSTVAVLIGRLSFAAPQRKQGRPSTLRRGIAGRGGAPGGLVRAADPGMNACREVSSYSATLMCVTALLTILRCV